MSTETPSEIRGKRRSRRLMAAAVVVVIAMTSAVAWWLLRGDAPAEVSIEAAAAQLVTEPTDVDPADTTQDASAAADTDAASTATAATTETVDASGTWVVDTTIGEFSYTDSTGTFVGFRVAEELAGIGAVDAVGRTPVVDGTLVIDGTVVTTVEIVADMTALTTDDRRRDGKVRGALDTAQFATASFRLVDAIDIGSEIESGATVRADARGELTVKGVTRPIVVPLEAQLVDDVIVVVGSTQIEFADYGVEVPTAPIVLSADDFGDVELQLFFRRA